MNGRGRTVFFGGYAHTGCMEGYEKVYVAVWLYVNEYGQAKPVAIEWGNGARYEIDKITDERNAPPDHVGGVLTRKYRIRVRGRDKLLYLETQSGRWFVERLTQ